MASVRMVNDIELKWLKMMLEKIMYSAKSTIQSAAQFGLSPLDLEGNQMNVH